MTDALVVGAVDRRMFFYIILAGKLIGKRDHSFQKNNRRCRGRSVITFTNTQTKVFAIFDALKERINE